MNKSRIYNKLAKVRRTIRENGISCEAKLFPRTETPVYQKVIEYIHEIKADMVLLMTHKEGVKNDNYIGAFSSHIINLADVPILSLTHSASEPDGTALLKKVVDPVGILFNQGFWSKGSRKQPVKKL
jgi:pentose-5-phosphate-3-epimerase